VYPDRGSRHSSLVIRVHWRLGTGTQSRSRALPASAVVAWPAPNCGLLAGRRWRQNDLRRVRSNNLASDQASLDALFDRFQRLLEQLDGHMHEIGREFRQRADLDLGPLLPLDEIFAGYDPSAHIVDDFFKNKLAFVVLLSFPLTTLEERIAQGANWTRRQWAEVRLAQRVSKRIPAGVHLALAQAAVEADTYISQYNIWMHHLVGNSGERLFPPGLRLLSHWSLRDEIKASYEDSKNGLAKQRMIEQVMERIITQTIPAAVVDNPTVDW